MAGAIAGTVVAGTEPPNNRWLPCDGRFILNVKYGDYWRRVTFSHGAAGIGGMRLPDAPGSVVCVTDDPDYTGAAPVNIDVPMLSQAADTLNCTTGNWDGTPTGYAYAWQIDGAAAGSSAATITVTAADVGKDAICTVTARNTFGETAAPPSNALQIEAFT